MAIPPTMFPTVAESLASVGLNERGRIVVEKPFGRDLAVGPRAQRRAARGLPGGRTSSASTTTSARSPSRTSSCSASPTRCSSRSGTVATCAACRSRCPRRSASRAGARSTTRSARSATCSRTTCCRCVSLLAMEPPVGHEAELPPGREGQGVRGHRAARLRQRSSAASTSATARSPASPPVRAPRRSSPPRCTSTRGAGPACRGTCASARASPRPPPRRWSSCASPPRMLFDEAGGPTPERNLIRLRLGKRDGVTFTLQAKTPGPHLDSQAVDLVGRLRRRPRRAPRAVRAAARRRPHRLAAALRPRGRRRADVAHRRPGPDQVRPHRLEPGAPLRPRLVGTQAGRLAAAPRRPLVRPVGVTTSSYTPAVTEASDAPTEDPRPDDLRRVPSVVVLNTGDGKGKSSAAFGVMIRAVARGWPVAVVQFVKSGKWHVGEEKIGRQLGVDWFNVGDGFTWDSADLEHDKELARAGWQTAAELIAAGAHRLVVLDEITYLCTWGVDRHGGGRRGDPLPAARRQHRAHRTRRPGRAGRRGRHRDRDAQGQARVRRRHHGAARHRVLTWRPGRCGRCSPTSRHPTTRRWPRCTHAPPRSCAHRARWRGWTTSPHGWRGGNARRDRASNGRRPSCSRPTTGSPPPSP